MENSKKVTASKKGGVTVLVATSVFLILLSIGSSFYFSKTIENFFWEARTKSTISIVGTLSKNLTKSDLAEWQKEATTTNLEVFAGETKKVLANIRAIKIYTTEGVLTWTDLQKIQKGTKDDGIESELAEIRGNGYLIKEASDATKKELANKNLLEVWVEITDKKGNTFGFAELYFDSNDIIAFTQKIKYSIWVGSLIILGLFLFLLRVIFRQQNSIILRQAKELSNIVEHSPFGIYTIDANGNALSINPKMLALINKVSPQDILGHNVLDLDYVKDTKSEDAIQGALSGKPFVKEITTTDEQGGEVHRLCTGTPLFTADGKTLEEVLFTVEDITARKKLEKEIALRSKNMEVVVHERTKSLQEKVDELEQFQKLTVNREVRMTELKQEIEKLHTKLKEHGIDYTPV